MSRNARLFNFHGITPLEDDANLEAAHAMEASDVNLHRGDLIPWKFGDVIQQEDFTVREMFDIERCVPFVAWDHLTDVTRAMPNCNDLGMIFWVQEGVPFQSTEDELCAGQRSALGVPCPTSAPSGGSGGGGEGCSIDASFVYTYVNSYGQEGPPSPASTVSLGGSGGGSVSVAGAPGGFNIVGARVYQSMAQSSRGDESALDSSGAMVLVGQGNPGGAIAINDLSYGVDDLPSEYWAMPPQQGITAMVVHDATNCMMLAVANTIYISEPGQYHAYPRHRDLTLRDNVIALVSIGETVVAWTDGHPYTIGFSRPQGDTPVYDAVRASESLPCLSKGSVAVGHVGTIASSTDGLFLISNDRFNGKVVCLTELLFEYQDWLELMPDTIVGEIYNGKYYFSGQGEVTNSITRFQTHSFILSFGDDVYTHPSNVELTSLSFRADDWYRTRKDKLHYSIEGQIFQWEPEIGTVVPFRYASRDIVETGFLNYAAAKVIHDRTGFLIFEIWRENCAESHCIFRRTIDHCNPFRLPRCLMGIDWYVRLTGTNRVRRVHMATSILDLTNHDDTTYTHGNKRLTARTS